MEKTTIYTIEITEIGEGPDRDIRPLIRDYLGADDVKVIKKQVFEFPRVPWTTDQYLIRLALQAKRGNISRSDLADAVIMELSKMNLPGEVLKCLE